jgi:hypothetical protein
MDVLHVNLPRVWRGSPEGDRDLPTLQCWLYHRGHQERASTEGGEPLDSLVFVNDHPGVAIDMRAA